MKKVIVSIVALMLIVGPVAYANNRIQATLFNVKIILNGHSIALSEKYEILNYKGYSYVPLRFITDQIDGKVSYYPKDKSIVMNLLHGPALPEKYPASLAEKLGDVVYTSPSQIKNFDQVSHFINSFNNKESIKFNAKNSRKWFRQIIMFTSWQLVQATTRKFN